MSGNTVVGYIKAIGPIANCIICGRVWRSPAEPESHEVGCVVRQFLEGQEYARELLLKLAAALERAERAERARDAALARCAMLREALQSLMDPDADDFAACSAVDLAHAALSATPDAVQDWLRAHDECVRKDEREACAKVADAARLRDARVQPMSTGSGFDGARELIAAAIRARTEGRSDASN